MSIHRFAEYTNQSTQAAASQLQGNLTSGLSTGQVQERSQRYGANRLQEHVVTWWQILLRQFRSSFIYLMVGAGVLAIALGEIIDGGMIFLFILINAALGFYQEFHSEKTFQLLKHFISIKSKVRRNGLEEFIDSAAITVGDIVIVESGDVLPADVRFIKTHDLLIDESVLTGEAVPVDKMTEALPEQVNEIYQASTIGFSGTTLVSGWAEGIVLAIGNQTMLGDIAQATTETTKISDFERNIKKFSSFILRLVIITLGLVVLLNVLIKGDRANLPDLAIFSITLVVGVIPEALPVVTTFCLSRGALRLAKRKVVVKRLSAVEDLGSIEILCSDKTGTLTENKMTVADTMADDVTQLVQLAALANAVVTDTLHRSINSFDLAITQKAAALGLVADSNPAERLNEIPFDPNRRCNSVLIKQANTTTLIVRGAPEVIMAASQLGHEQQQRLQAWITAQGKQGRRILAIASKTGVTINYNVAEETSGLQFIGCLALADPIKASTIHAIRRARQLGVSIKILTGDSKEVAGAVAHQVGLIKQPDAVITGADFARLSHDEQLLTAKQHHVFARLSPEQKYQLIKLYETNHDVGFLGDGINDAPALKAANVALVVQGATDIAREAADIILLEQSLDTIITGIQEGRGVFTNTIKYIKATLASNYGNFYSVAIASLFIDFLPMLPLQILLVNLLSDFPMIAIATDSVDQEELRRPRSYDIKEIFLLCTILGVISTLIDFVFFVLFYKMGPAILQTNWFIGSILTELVFIFSIRTHRFFLRSRRPSGSLIALSLAGVIGTIVIPFTALGQSLFHFVTPSWNHLMIIFTIVAVYFVLTELVKFLYYSHLGNSNYGTAITPRS
ncbi:MAG: HAD-IC family P-type ATPase [Candidatus Kerfeldbacteria bacterium]|nr:HAD-IC family P-type ATPase [Candidatus Kerfeldbacteria bacterium]